MAKPNYQFAKRQRDLEKKRKKEAKRLRKLAERQSRSDGTPAGEESSAGSGVSPETPASHDPSTA